MGQQKKAEKWAKAVGLPTEPCFWASGDSAPLKEFLARLLSVELVKTSADLTQTEPIPFEKFKLGIYTCLVGGDLANNDVRLKLGLFGTVIYCKSALKDFKTELLAQVPFPDFGIAGGNYSNPAICGRCKRDVLYIERVVVAERVWHRRCMHCHLCGKRLFLGMFRVENEKLECFDHFLNKELVQNELSDCLNPFGYTSSEESDVEQPVPTPRRSIQSAIEEAIEDTDEKKRSRQEDEAADLPKKVSTEEPPKSTVELNEKHIRDLKKLVLEPYTDTVLDLCPPASLVLCKGRLIDLSGFDRAKLLHELDKVIKTLDYIERHTTDIETELCKEIAKGSTAEFKWEKSSALDDWARAMNQKHDNLLKGSMIVHEYLRKLIQAAMEKCKSVEGKQDLSAKLAELLQKLDCNRVSLPTILENGPSKENVTPKPAKDEKKGKRSLVKRIKKVF